MIAIGVCRSTFADPVFSDGAAALGSSGAAAYSSSNPMMTRPNPSAPPRACRLDGDMFAPMNAVTSALAGAAHDADKMIPRMIARTRVMNPSSLHHKARCPHSSSPSARLDSAGLHAWPSVQLLRYVV